MRTRILKIAGFILAVVAVSMIWPRIRFIFGMDIARQAEVVASMLEDYRTRYGAYPTGDTKQIVQSLVDVGMFDGNPPLVNYKRQFADPWGNPYRIYFSDEFGALIVSAGPDGTFERGRGDDRIYWSRWKKRNSQPAGGAYVSPGAGETSAHP